MFEKCYDAKPNFGEVPLHSLDDREYWDRLKPYVEEMLRDYPKEYVVLPASRYMDFYFNGNRKKYEDLYFANRRKLKALALLEAVRNDGKLLPDIIDGVWGVLDEVTWCLPAHGSQGTGDADALPDIDDYVLDLYQAETGALLAEVYYLFKDKFDEYSKNINKRLIRALKDRVITPFNTNAEYWWMGLNAKESGKLLNLRPDTLRQILYMLEAISLFEARDKAEFVHDESYYIESTQVKTIHKGVYDVAAKAGHNYESHNHNDVGNFIIAKDKTLFIIDTGWMDYCKDTFNENRFKIWVNQSPYHNLPEIDGKGQKNGREYTAKDVVSTKNGFGVDIALAYEDENVVKWMRKLDVCEDGVKITEDFEYQKLADTVLHLMTQFEPKAESYGLSLVSSDGKKMEVHFDGDFTFDTISTGNDVRLNTNWGKTLYRINIPIGEVKSGNYGYIFK